MSLKRIFVLFCITHAVTYGLIILIMIYGWGLWPKSWAVVIIGYAAVSFVYPLMNWTAKKLAGIDAKEESHDLHTS